MWNYLDRGCTVSTLYQTHASLLVSDTRPRPTATPSNLEGELNLAGVQCVSGSSPKLEPSKRSEPIRKVCPIGRGAPEECVRYRDKSN